MTKYLMQVKNILEGWSGGKNTLGWPRKKWESVVELILNRERKNWNATEETAKDRKEAEFRQDV